MVTYRLHPRAEAEVLRVRPNCEEPGCAKTAIGAWADGLHFRYRVRVRALCDTHRPVILPTLK